MEATPPIDKLNNDVLCYIFSLNANMFLNSNALAMTRRTSQVCRYWRDSMLTTASLWAKLLDFDALPEMSDTWGAELLRRSGQSPLWIKANFSRRAVSRSLLQIFVDIVDGNWQRIQNLTLSVPRSGFQEHMRSLPWALPAPQLQIFNVNLTSITKDWMSSEQALLPFFTDAAPMLREFKTNSYDFSARAPWLQQVRYLEIQTSSLTLSDIFTALECASNLVDLVISPMKIIRSPDGNPPSFPVLRLLKLRRLLLSPASLEVQHILLEHLIIPPSCTLDFSSPPLIDDHHVLESEDALTQDDLSEDAVEPWIKSLAKHVRRFFKLRQPTFLYLSYSPHEILVEDHDWPRGPYFRFGMSSTGPSIPSYIYEFLLKEIAHPELHSIKHFNLSVHDNLSSFGLESLFLFFSCLPRLEVLEIQNDALLHNLLEAEIDYSESDYIFFPLLKTIELHGLVDYADALHDFIQNRQSIGKPIATLIIDVKTVKLRIPIPDLSFLEEFTGLEVVCVMHSDDYFISERLEYVCGSGRPEELEFP